MKLIHGPVRLILWLQESPTLSDADIERFIEHTPSLQPSLLLHGHNPKTGQWPVVGRITRVWRQGKSICQEAVIDSGVEIDKFAALYVRIEVLP